MPDWTDRCATAPAAAEEGGRILVIEDDPLFARSLAELLGKAGYETMHAGTGGDALRRLSSEPFDLALVDLSLPDISGQAVIEGARQGGCDLPLIVVSGETQIDAAIAALRLGAADYVRKPIEPAILLHSIRKSLKQYRIERQHRDFLRRIEASERLHRFLVERSPDLIFTLDGDGNIEFVNDRLESLLGLDRDAFAGQHFSAIAHLPDLERARYAFSRRSLAEKQVHSVELRLRSRLHPGGFRHFETVVAPVTGQDHAGTPADAAATDAGGYYGVARDITERREAEAWAAFHANHDALTGLPNHTLFRDRLGLSLIQARRNREGLAVLFLNLNRFKPVNDLLGQAKGDELLRQIPGRVQPCLRGGDTLARFGGDEFLLLLTQIASRDEVLAVLNRIVEELRHPFALGDRQVPVSVSAGIALYPDSGETPDALIRHANIALYQGKLNGSQAHTFFVEEMRSSTAYKLHIEDELRNAAERGEFDVYYQPQVGVEDRRIRGVEALVRWRHPTRGLLCPGEFLAVAEEAGMISTISEWVLDKACEHLAAWEAKGIAPPRLSINVSPQFLERQDFIDRFIAVAGRHDVNLERLEIEITENLFIRDPLLIVEKLKQLSEAGIRVAIDDFGTQYSSLSYLQTLPVHTLKIDKSFVSTIGREHKQNAIVQAIISIAHSLGLDLIAEGVETEDQAGFLAQQGCGVIQGFLVGRPIPFPALEDMLKAQYYQAA